tara:strand:+ start:227 stop:394 length:168 start_codon:yes stop_codon:yes gene_type:complete
MNINYIEQEILKAIDIERQGVQEEDSYMTLETIEDRFTDLKKFVKKLFKENREGF